MFATLPGTRVTSPWKLTLRELRDRDPGPDCHKGAARPQVGRLVLSIAPLTHRQDDEAYEQVLSELSVSFKSTGL